MKKDFVNPPITEEELEKLQEWLSKQAWLTEEQIADRALILILYKFYQLEERLARIEYNQQTHWVN